MTPQELKTQFEGLVQDSYDVTHVYQLFTQAKNLIESTLKLLILQDSDSSQTHNSGDTYLTMKPLPATCRQVLKVFVGTTEYFPCQFQNRIRYRNASRRYYIDWKNNQFAICGTGGSSQTITLVFLTSTVDISESNETDPDVIVWPSEWHPLIPYEAAKIYQSNIDADSIAFRMSAAQEREYNRLRAGLLSWDTDLKLAAMNGQGGYADEGDDFDLGLM